ncbi:MAG: LacI family DNA-binding transcriptional regulator [Erythrobacter sp.]|jgi:DNA-binding LacI/PurR family transcriptional regulator|uniref:LacI family DNA-binding transcriptional regulator n=1 Tax=Erythrobacter sp. TaxID=1042 RepID=UPI002B4691A5|nr:LacI family DNA-binding transcriptional regulator [Erythrobacter sp.]WRH70210.1 MAG: LacI family DNA-binding transcriptional regulator [Erythrobacter sp.]
MATDDERTTRGSVRTITDLARIAGVSPGTVSRALAGKSLVNTKTREKIEAIAREHGFRPNQMASGLRRQKTGVIGMVIPLGHDARQQISDSFFMTLLGFLADELTNEGYDLMLRRVVPEDDADWLDRFIGSGMIDGVIVIGQSDQFERIEEVADGYRPMVVWGNHTEGQRHCVVGTDNRLGGRLAAERLIAAGATRLAFLGDTGPMEFAARFAGAQDVAVRLGVPITALPTHLSPDRASAEIAGHLGRVAGSVDGIFAATDTLAALCLTELRARGLRVPEDIRLVGFDDLPIARQTVPPLTTVRQDIAGGARGLVQLLLRRLAGEETESLVMPPQLVIRHSA